MRSTVLVFLGIMTGMSLAYAEPFKALELEPAINGTVSSSGLFPSQALENRYGADSILHIEYDEFGIEPAINGNVSASGLFPSQAMEDNAKDDSWRLMGDLADKGKGF